MNQWTFTGLEFTLLWEQAGRDVLPYPLQYQHRVETRSELSGGRRDAARSLIPQLDESLHRALFVLALPQVRVQIAGFEGLSRERRIRIHAGIRDGLAVFAAQQPGADADTGADIRLTVLPARAAAHALIEELPKIPAAQGEPLSVLESELSVARAPLLLHDIGDSGAREKVRRFLDRPRIGIGHIAVHSGPAYDNRPTEDGGDFHWMDFHDDGRYLTRAGKYRTADPADAAMMVSTLQRLLNETSHAHAFPGNAD